MIEFAEMSRNCVMTGWRNTMKMFASAFLIVFAVLCGCTPSYRIRTDATNYRGNLTIEKKDYDFYNGDYVGSGKNCFPPIENRICPNYTKNEVYKPSKKLKWNYSLSA